MYFMVQIVVTVCIEEYCSRPRLVIEAIGVSTRLPHTAQSLVLSVKAKKKSFTYDERGKGKSRSTIIFMVTGQKKTFSDHFFPEEALSEEQLVIKFGKNKNGGRSYQKKCYFPGLKSNVNSGDRKASPSPRRTDA